MRMNAPGPVRFQGIYALNGGCWGPTFDRLNEATEAIKQKAAARNLPLLVEEETKYEGMGETSLIRYFITGPDAEARKQRLRQEAVAKRVIQVATDAVKAAAKKALDGVKDKALAEQVASGALTQAEADAVKNDILLNVSLKTAPVKTEELRDHATAYHHLLFQFVTRGGWDGRPRERAHFINAVKNDHFDVETGELKPSTPFEPEPATPAHEWYKEP